VAAAHRTGTLAPGEASLAVAVSSPHRDAAYRASRWIVEEVKRRLPVWKREAYADGTEAWLDGHPAGSAP
jgi:molybdopterin synthase catalytic subunit